MNDKVYEVKDGDKTTGYIITSPDTGQDIMFDNRWTFNGDFEHPTFWPSMVVDIKHEVPSDGLVREHFFVRNGKIQYLRDCNHEMAGQTVDMIRCSYYD